VPDVCCDKPSYSKTLFGSSPTIPSNGFIQHPNCINANTAPTQSILNGQTNVPCVSTSSENCLQMITNAIITKVQYKVPQQEIALLCCCLPSLIRQIMCKSPCLTPYDIIQCLSEDIIVKTFYCQ
jgi:hypothetical protein